MLNTLLLAIGCTQHYALSLPISSAMMEWSYTLILFTMRNLFLLQFIQYVTRHKPPLSTSVPRESYPCEFHLHLLRSTAVESLTHVLIKKWVVFSAQSHMVLWIPMCFLFEVVFDFFHYLAHRGLHHPWVYRYLHKTHHRFDHPIAITAFYQDPIDLLLTNSIPTFLSLSLLPSFSYFEWNLMTIYKTFIEIAGHTGKASFPIASFPPLMWLPKALGIELYTEDHDLHHSMNHCNYAKRFSLWDRVGGTYRRF